MTHRILPLFFLSLLLPACLGDSTSSEPTSGTSASKQVKQVSPTLDTFLVASDRQAGDNFGHVVAIDGDTMVIGSPGEDGDGEDNVHGFGQGAAYLFEHTASGWVQQAKLTPQGLPPEATMGAKNIAFGTSVALDADTLVVGATGESPTTNFLSIGFGAAFVFTRQGETWTWQATLRAHNPGGGDYFGEILAIDGDTIALSALYEDSDAQGTDGDGENDKERASGAVYVFERMGDKWRQVSYLKASDSRENVEFGRGLAIRNGLLAVGAPGTSRPEFRQGAVYLFSKTDSGWIEHAKISSPFPEDEAEFGTSVGLGDEFIAVGAPGQTKDAVTSAGSLAPQSGVVYMYDLDGEYKSIVNPLAAAQGGMFGASLSIDGDLMVVSAPEDGVIEEGEDPATEWKNDGGVLRVFENKGGTWDQIARVRSRGVKHGSQFGMNGALSGRRFVAGSSYAESEVQGEGFIRTGVAFAYSF